MIPYYGDFAEDFFPFGRPQVAMPFDFGVARHGVGNFCFFCPGIALSRSERRERGLHMRCSTWWACTVFSEYGNGGAIDRHWYLGR